MTMTINFITTRYESDHGGKKPRGRRAWAFLIVNSEGKMKKAITPPGFMTYTEAKAKAIEILKGFGITEADLHVEP